MPHLLAVLLLLTACAPVARAPDSPRYKPLEFALLEDYDKGEDLASIADDFRVMRELGIDTWRGSFGWDDYEPEPGKYDLAWLKQFVALAEREGIRLRPYLGYTPAWAAAGGSDDQAWNDPPRDVAAWRSYVAELARTFRDSPAVLSWEIYNEENARLWWDGTVEQYARVLAAGAEAVRAEDPDARVILGGLTYPDVQWLEAVCETHGQARAFDVAALHAYPETWSEPGVTVENYLEDDYPHEWLGTLRGGCAGQPVWINETGFATTPGRTELQQASWWVRAIATFAADSAVEHIGVYEMRDLREDSPVIGDAPNYYLGLRRVDGSRKLAFHTVRLLVRLLGDRVAVLDRALKYEPAADDVYAHLFQRPEGDRLLIAWTSGDGATVRVRLPRGTGRGTSYSLTGDSTALPLARVLELRLERDRPQVIRFAR